MGDKKRKVVDQQRPASKVFAPFRTIGLVTDGTPFATSTLGQSFTIACAIDRSFQIYDAAKLHLLFVSQPRTPARINCLHSYFHWTFAGWNNAVSIYRRGKLDDTITLPSDESVERITTFGEYLCIATKSAIYVYKRLENVSGTVVQAKWGRCELHTTCRIPQVLGDVQSMMHLPTYLNKLVVATATSLLVLNVRTGKIVFTTNAGEFDSAKIRAAAQAPVLDIVGVATDASEIVIFDMRKAKKMMTLHVSKDEVITSLSFRTDGKPHLAVGCSSGALFIFDLEKRKRIHTLRNAHDNISHLDYLAGQPILVTNGQDNKLQEIGFDDVTPPRILRYRAGHALPPSAITFTDEDAHFVLSASRDQSLWQFSLRKDAQNQAYSQRLEKYEKTSKTPRLPEITCMAYQAAKQGRWANVVTGHKGLSYAHVWDAQRGIIGKHKLATLDKSLVKSVALSPCGNFAVIGSAQGSVAVYNMQSGILRRKVFALESRHSKAVTGCAVDPLNRFIVSSSLDKTVRFFQFKDCSLLKSVSLPSAVTSLNLHPKTGLLVVTLDDFSLVVIDTQTYKVIRVLRGHSNRITSVDFSADGRWIFSASLDCTIRVWDIPSGGCIDAAKVDNVVTNIKCSPNGEWLATSQVANSGVQLWSMRSQFHFVSNRVVSETEIEEMPQIDVPNAIGEGGVSLVDGALTSEEQAAGVSNCELDNYQSPATLSTDLQSLSIAPRSKFNNLLYLDDIRLRNKSKETATTAQKDSPFFLGQTNNLVSDGNTLSASTEQSTSNVPSGINKVKGVSTFTQLLNGDDKYAFINHLRDLSPALTDLEIRSLDINAEEVPELCAFVEAMVFCLTARRDYELAQVWMSMFLRIHGDVVVANASTNETLNNALKAWEKCQTLESARLDDLTHYCSGVVSYLRVAN